MKESFVTDTNKELSTTDWLEIFVEAIEGEENRLTASERQDFSRFAIDLSATNPSIFTEYDQSSLLMEESVLTAPWYAAFLLLGKASWDEEDSLGENRDWQNYELLGEISDKDKRRQFAARMIQRCFKTYRCWRVASILMYGMISEENKLKLERISANFVKETEFQKCLASVYLMAGLLKINHLKYAMPWTKEELDEMSKKWSLELPDSKWHWSSGLPPAPNTTTYENQLLRQHWKAYEAENPVSSLAGTLLYQNRGPLPSIATFRKFLKKGRRMFLEFCLINPSYDLATNEADMIANLKGVSTASDLDSLRKNILEKYCRKKRRAASVEWKELEKTEQEAKKIEEELEVAKKKLAEFPTGATESQNDSHHRTRTRAEGTTEEQKELEKVVERLEKFRDDIVPRVQRKRKAVESYINMQEVKKPKVRRQAASSRKEVVQQESLPPKRMTSSSRIEYSKPSKLWTKEAWVKVGCLHVLAVIIKHARAVRVIELDVNTSFGEEAKETQRRTNAAFFDTLAKYVNDKKNTTDQFTAKDLAMIKPTTKVNTMDLLINGPHTST